MSVHTGHSGARAEIPADLMLDIGGDGRPGPETRRRPRGASTWGVAALLGVVALIVYWRTLAPSIEWGDSPELTTAAYCAGVPHPTGYPLYMMLAHAFLCLCPLGSPAYRMNMLAALSGSIAVALIYLLLVRVTRSRWASLVIALLFAFSRTFWSQAVIAEHYPFEMLCIAAVLGCVLAWDRRGDRRWLRASAFVYGLCLTHHMMSLLLAPGLLFFALSSRRRAQFLRELRWTLPLFMLPLTLYVYLPLAALRDPPANWGDPRTWSRFVAHVTGRQYHDSMFHLTRAELWIQVKDYAGFLPAQFTPPLLWLAPLGIWSLARRQRRLLGLTLLIYLADVVYALNYYIYNGEIYYLPSHLMAALWISCGLRQAGVWLGIVWRRLALPPSRRKAFNALCGTALLLLPLMLLAANWKVNDRHDDWSALIYARATLATLKPHAVLLGHGDDTYFPLLYTHYVEHQRPDVTLVAMVDAMAPSHLRLITRHRAEGLNVGVPRGFEHLGPGSRPSRNALLKQLIVDNIRHRPIYMVAPPSAPPEPWLVDAIAPFCQVQDSNLARFELTRRPPRLAVANPQPQHRQQVAFGPLRPGHGKCDDVRLLGYDLTAFSRDDLPMLRITYYWHIDDPVAARPARVWVLFTDARGNYQRQPDGAPQFDNIHPLGYGLGLHGVKLPRTLRETYALSVPPAVWNRRLHVRLGVAVKGRFLAARGQRSPWVELGQFSVAGRMEGPNRAAWGVPTVPRVAISQQPDAAVTPGEGSHS